MPFDRVRPVFFAVKLLNVDEKCKFCRVYIFLHLFKSLLEMHTRSVSELYLAIMSLILMKSEVNRPIELVSLVQTQEL